MPAYLLYVSIIEFELILDSGDSAALVGKMCTSSRVYVSRVMSLVFTNSGSPVLNWLSSLTVKEVGSRQNLEIW